jgi:hypothetical protein
MANYEMKIKCILLKYSDSILYNKQLKDDEIAQFLKIFFKHLKNIKKRFKPCFLPQLI